MKKIILLFILSSIAFADGYNIIWDKNGNYLEIKSNKMATYSVSCSSITATLIRPANTSRKGISIYNNGNYTVYLSTYAATSTANLYPLVSGSGIDDNGIQCYIGAWYGLTEAGQSAQEVRVIEKQ